MSESKIVFVINTKKGYASHDTATAQGMDLFRFVDSPELATEFGSLEEVEAFIEKHKILRPCRVFEVLFPDAFELMDSWDYK